jgi:hypothetical protein
MSANQQRGDQNWQNAKATTRELSQLACRSVVRFFCFGRCCSVLYVPSKRLLAMTAIRATSTVTSNLSPSLLTCNKLNKEEEDVVVSHRNPHPRLRPNIRPRARSKNADSVGPDTATNGLFRSRPCLHCNRSINLRKFTYKYDFLLQFVAHRDLRYGAWVIRRDACCSCDAFIYFMTFVVSQSPDPRCRLRLDPSGKGVYWSSRYGVPAGERMHTVARATSRVPGVTRRPRTKTER